MKGIVFLDAHMFDILSQFTTSKENIYIKSIKDFLKAHIDKPKAVELLSWIKGEE